MKDLFYKLSANIQSLMQREEGQDLIEYALIVGLVALGATAALTSIGTSVKDIFNSLQTAMSSAAAAS